MIYKYLQQISKLDESAMELTKKRLDSIAKPLHGLGLLEDHMIQLAGIYKTENLPKLKKALVVMCADNGVVCEGVTQTGQEVTAIVSNNLLETKTNVAVMAKKADVFVLPVDVGVAVDTKIRNEKVAYGTKNMAIEDAMTHKEVVMAIEVGIKMVKELVLDGYNVICTGEMGIGNTTTSSALASILLNQDVKAVTGRGAGLSDEALQIKIQVIERAIKKRPIEKENPLDLLASVGGLDIAALVGVCLAGAMYRVPIILDGVITSVAALLATRLHENVKDYVIASHCSKEPAARMILEELGKEASIWCNFCLGEGTGAVAFLPVLELGLEVYHEMSTFDDIQVEQYKPL